MYKVICQICGKEFLGKVPHAKNCSNKCRMEVKKRYYAKKKEETKNGIITQGGKSGNFLRMRFRIFERDCFRCSYCGRDVLNDGVKLEIEHIKPRNKNGDDLYHNLTTSCRECNVGKGDYLLNLRNKEYIKRRNKTFIKNKYIK